MLNIKKLNGFLLAIFFFGNLSTMDTADKHKISGSGTLPIARLMHNGNVRSIAITPDGRQAITASSDGPVRLWDLSTYGCTTELTQHGKHMVEATSSSPRDFGYRLAVTPNGKYVIILTADGKLLVWDLQNEQYIGTPIDVGDGECMAITSDGKYIPIGKNFSDKDIQLFELDTAQSPNIKKDIFTSSPINYAITALAPVPHSSKFLIGDAQGRIYEETIEPSRRYSTILFCCHSCVNSIAVSDATPSGEHIIVAADSSSISVFSLQKARIITTFNNTGCITAITITPDNKYIIAGGYNKKINIYEIATRSLITQLSVSDAIRSLAVTPDGKTLLTGGNDKTVHVWNLEEILKTSNQK